MVGDEVVDAITSFFGMHVPIDAELLQVVNISVIDVVALVVVFVFVDSTTSLIGRCVEQTVCVRLYRDG